MILIPLLLFLAFIVTTLAILYNADMRREHEESMLGRGFMICPVTSHDSCRWLWRKCERGVALS